MKKPFFAIILALLLLHLASAADIEPKKTGTATANIKLEWRVDLGGQTLNELQVRTFSFGNYASQNRVTEITNPPASESMDAFGNKIKTFNLDPSKNYQTFSMNSQVDVRFGFDFPTAGDSGNYLKDSKYIISTPEIRSKALSIASDYATDLEKVVAIAQFVHNNVRYDKAYISLVKGSDAVYTERAGTCDEFSHLFIAMVRAIGIPAKFSASYVYSGTDWGAHAFVEVAIDGKWLPFDPTFNEGIILDATHIKFGEGFDQGDIKEDISIKSFGADVSKIKLIRDFSVNFEGTGKFPKLFEIEMVLPINTVGEKSIEEVKVKLKNGPNRIAIPLSLQVPPEVKIPGENSVNEDKLVLLMPGEEKEIAWKVILPPLQEGYDYKFPVKVESLGQNAEGTILASKDANAEKSEELQITDITSVENGGLVQVAAKIKNLGNVDSAGTIAIKVGDETQEKPFSITVGSEIIVGFTLKKSLEKFSGEFVINTDKFEVTQPFSVNLESTPAPTPDAPFVISTPTNEPESYIPGVRNEYAITGIVMFLFLFLFLVKKW
ncbi:transglutaminase domain-containing protein [Candidatus Micrarchaeota archaeon]|nr:transglutaminase domain-containing protein [Candidatus Micrarchaeota archaeon]